MPRSLSAKPPKPFERVMVFVDGGYLRELCKKYYKHDNIDFEALYHGLIRNFNDYEFNLFQADLIRIYYYDAIVEEGHSDYKAQREYFDDIEGEFSYTVRLGRLVKSSKKKFKQKGVDILMAIDALTKAYQDHYDTGIFFVGDRDFLPLIEAVKDAGKKTLCYWHTPDSSIDLIRCFDHRIRVTKEIMEEWLKEEP